METRIISAKSNELKSLITGIKQLKFNKLNFYGDKFHSGLCSDNKYICYKLELSQK